MVGGVPRLPRGTTDRVEAALVKLTDTGHALCVTGTVAVGSTSQQLMELPPAKVGVNTNQRVASNQLGTPEPPADSLQHPTH